MNPAPPNYPPSADAAMVKIDLAKIDGEPSSQSPFVEHLRAAGFTDGYKGLTLRA